MDFDERKSAVLASLASSKDKSPKGSLDAPILPLIEVINRNPCYFTTSSCSGRISIFSHPSDVSNSKKKGRGGSWVFITHEPADPDIVVDLLYGPNSTQLISHGDLVLRFEPFILAVECKYISSAQSLISTAISCGFRESGITNIDRRIMVAVRSSTRLEVPLGGMGELKVTTKYVRYLILIANEKMAANRQRTDSLFNILLFRGKPCAFEGKDGLKKVNAESESVCQVKGGLAQDNCATSVKSYAKDEEPSAGSCKKEVEDLHDICYLAADVYYPAESKTIIGAGANTLCQGCLSGFHLAISGQPVEKLLTWGQTASSFTDGGSSRIFVFGGFGGVGNHARTNDTLVLDPSSGSLAAVDVDKSPSPRLGHISVVVGQQLFVIGGRGDRMQNMGDVWALDVSKWKWNLLNCTGDIFHPRNRHAAAVVGPKIYIFGGLDDSVIYSSMSVINTDTFEWSIIHSEGKDWPIPRHSHSLVAYGRKVFLFGGYDGERLCGDFYSFDVDTCSWVEEKTEGDIPSPRAGSGEK